jgi:mono/diheme cytochrome c family protein
MTRLIIVAFLVVLAAVAVATAAAQAQDAGRPQRGLAVARGNCAECHAVQKGERRSPNPDAPSFATLATTPGMTGIALTAALRTSHRTMPNVILDDDVARDVVAYILSLNSGE